MSLNLVSYLLFVAIILFLYGCREKDINLSTGKMAGKRLNVYQDRPYLQDYSIKYYLTQEQKLPGVISPPDFVFIHIEV